VASALYASGLLPESTRLAVPLALGVLAGIVAWFALVMSLARRIGQRAGERAAAKGSRIVAVLLLLAAAWLAVSAMLAAAGGDDLLRISTHSGRPRHHRQRGANLFTSFHGQQMTGRHRSGPDPLTTSCVDVGRKNAARILERIR
jgi:hypothetical protein